MFAWAEPLNGAMDFSLITIVLIFDVVVQKIYVYETFLSTSNRWEVYWAQWHSYRCENDSCEGCDDGSSRLNINKHGSLTSYRLTWHDKLQVHSRKVSLRHFLWPWDVRHSIEMFSESIDMTSSSLSGVVSLSQTFFSPKYTTLE